MISENFSVKIDNETLYVFYQRYMVGNSEYELFPDEERTEELEKTEYNVIVTTGSSVDYLQSLIMRYAEVELEMQPLKLFFPKQKIEYINVMNTLFSVADNRIKYLETVLSLEQLPEYAEEYENVIDTLIIVREIFLKEIINTNLLNEYFNA